MQPRQHEWVAIFQIHLTNKEAAQAYTFDSHGKKVIASKMHIGDGFVDVGCIACEQPYQLVNSTGCGANLATLNNQTKGGSDE